MFKIIDDILNDKRGDSIDRNDFNQEFNLYMIQRWLSIHSDLNVEILNSTVNILYKTLDDGEHYKMMMKILPPTKNRGKYIKASPKDFKKKRDEVYIAEYLEESSKKIDESLMYVLGAKNEENNER